MDLLNRFKQLPLLKEFPSGPLIVAVSGGPDSVCLLDLLCRLSKERKWSLVAAHIQHHLRGKESLGDEAFVRGLAQKRGVPFESRSIHPPREKGTEEASRKMRYRALSSIACKRGASAIFLGHQADDQAETFLMNLLRGAGTQGLSGIHPQRPFLEVTGNPKDASILVFRPLLSWTRQEILSYLKERKIPFRTDRSNRSLKFRRNWVRLKILPLLKAVQPQISRRLTDLSSIFQIENRLWSQELDKMEKEIIKPSKQLDLRSFFGYDISFRYKWLHRRWPHRSFRQIAQTEAFLEKNFRQGRSYTTLEPEKGRQFSNPETLSVPGRTVLKDWNLEIRSRLKRIQKGSQPYRFSGPRSAFFDADKIDSAGGKPEWIVRNWRPGDRFRPLGLKGSKKLQDFFVDVKVPRQDRSKIPVLEAGGKIRWIVGFRTDEESKIEPSTRNVVEIKVDAL